MLIGFLGLAYIFNRLFPLTCFVVITFFAWAAWVSFVQHEETGDTSAKIWAAMVILAFVLDVLRHIRNLFKP